MGFIMPLFFGFITALIGVFPPGLINMTAAKISILDGKLRAMMFVFGALITIFFQTYISLVFANYIDTHQEILILFREVGLVIFIALSIYFFVFAKKQKIKENNNVNVKSKTSRFFMGIIISGINFFPIPYYVLISVALASYNLFVFNELSVNCFVVGVLLGSFTIFYSYIIFFNKLKMKTDFFINNMNTIIGSITGFIALLSLYNIVKFYWK